MEKYEKVESIAQCYHCNEHHPWTEIEPASNETDDGLYYLADDVDFEISGLKDAIAKSMKQTDELIEMVDGLLS